METEPTTELHPDRTGIDPDDIDTDSALSGRVVPNSQRRGE